MPLPSGMASWPWLQPLASSDVALLLFGRIGKLEHAPSSVDPAHASHRVVGFGFRSLRRQVLDANPSSTIDRFCHSWNPNMADYIDQLYHPIWSRHEPLRPELNKVQSAALSLRRVLLAKAAHEQKRSRRYDLVVATRYDLAWFAPFRWGELAQAQLWFPAQCCPLDHAITNGLAASTTGPIANRVANLARETCAGTDSDMPARIATHCKLSDFLKVSPSGSPSGFQPPAMRLAAATELGHF